jgi:hypothetical protein
MSEPYVTIGGKQVYPRSPTSAELHPAPRSPVAWEEGWQRETTRVSVPIGTVILIAILALILIRALRNRSESDTTPRS